MPEIKIALIGDVLVTHRLPTNNSGLSEISQLFALHDCCIGNLETVVRNDEGYPEAFPGGGSCFCSPSCLKDLKELGFSMFSTANNHSMDYGHGGLLATVKYLDELGIPHAGTGKNLAEASKAAHYETAQGRIALVNVTSSFHDSYLAGPQNQDVCGRPGVAPLRHKALYTVPMEDYNHLRRIASLTGINSYHDQAIKEGYLGSSNYLKFSSLEFMGGVNYEVSTKPLDADLSRTVAVIQDASFESDIVVTSVHSHQFLGEKSVSPQFIELFCRSCVDAGSKVVFCHGPHLLRGIEVYNGSVIFYGLGDFILQHESMEYLPEEMYMKYGTSRSAMSGVQSLMQKRSDGGKKGLVASPDAWESVIVSLSIDGAKTSVKLIPVRLSLHNAPKGLKGLPYLSSDESTIRKIAQLSERYGTTIGLNGSTGFLEIRQ